jgi:hypothetical protein
MNIFSEQKKKRKNVKLRKHRHKPTLIHGFAPRKLSFSLFHFLSFIFTFIFTFMFTTTDYDIQPGSPLTTEDLFPLAFGTALVCSLVGRRRGATERRAVSVLTATDGPLAGSSATGSLRPREERRRGGAASA